MLKLLKKTYWKYFSILLLAYVIIGGLLVPLGPGLYKVSPSVFAADSMASFRLEGFNTHFNDGADLQVWFKNGTDFYCAEKVSPVNNASLMLYFNFPASASKKLRETAFDIIVNNRKDGTITLREAVGIASAQGGDSAADKEKCAPRVAVNKASAFSFPYREILYQSIRNIFFHVPMWFTMIFILMFSLVYSILYLRRGRMEDDIMASQAVYVALLFGLLGITTGSVWARYTWGSFWPNDPKLNGAAIGIIIYLAYVVLRGSLADEIKRARISAVYNVFAVVIFNLFILVIPRLTDSLHPGNGGNPAFSKYDLDSHLRLFFYPAVIGWAMLGFWILSIAVRTRLLEYKKLSDE